MHSNQITSSNYHSLHKSQESPTLPVSTATDSSYYNGQQPAHCAGSPFGQLGTYQYHSSATSSVPYNAKSYDLGFNSSYGTYGSYGSNSSPTPADTGRRALKFVLEHFACIQWLRLWPKHTAEHVWVHLYAQYLIKKYYYLPKMYWCFIFLVWICKKNCFIYFQRKSLQIHKVVYFGFLYFFCRAL